MAGAGATTTTPAGGERSGLVAWMAGVGLAALVAVVVVAVSVLLDQRDRIDDAEAQVVAEHQAGLMASALQEIETAVEHRTSELCGDGVDPPGAVVRCIDREAIDRSPDPSLATALVRARDRGVAVLSAPTDDDPPVVVMVTARYRTAPGEDVTHEASRANNTARRDELAGFVAAELIVADLVEPTDRAWRVTDGFTVLADSGEPVDAAASAKVPILDRQWTVAVGAEEADAPVSAWFLGGLGVAAALLLGGADRERRRALRARSVEAAHAEGRAAALRTLAGVVQQGQDLDEILPALAVQLSDELGLAGLSLTISGADARARAVFVHGASPDGAVAPTVTPSGSLAPGETLALDLHRADRSVAVLRVVAGADLDGPGIDLLQVAGEMITSTLVSNRSLEQQQEAVKRLETLDELKTTFLGVASHELRTPATAISGLAAVLAERWDDMADAERRVLAQRIAVNAGSLNALVQDLLDFARLERGDFELLLEPVDLSGLVDGLLDRLASVWDDHPVDRHIQPGVRVRGDAKALERVVTNLLSNAVNFSPEAAPVVVSVERAGGRAVLLVDDAGPGVPEQERDKIFVRFFRGTGDAVVRTRGVGIGLSVVQDFVAQMGGEVRVDTSPAGGARFAVEIDEIDEGADPSEEERDAATT